MRARKIKLSPKSELPIHAFFEFFAGLEKW
jgi:hypothetical protein